MSSTGRFLLGLAGVFVAAACLGVFVGFLLFHRTHAEHVAAVRTAVVQPKIEVPPELAALTPLQQRIVHIAITHGVGSGYIYRWGGSNPPYFDCSGYVGFVLRAAGVYGVPRTSQAMYAYAPTHVSPSQIRPGDVVFFVSYGGRVSPGHVGLAISRTMMIEYYRTGLPARERLISRSDFIGGGRWWHVPHVSRALASRAFWVARHFHERISWSSGKTVQFLPRHNWKIIRWARHARYTVHSRPGYVNITFVKRPLPPLTPQQKLRARTGYWSWLAWYLGRESWRHYGLSNPHVRPDVPAKIPRAWWRSEKRFIAANRLILFTTPWGIALPYSDLVRIAVKPLNTS